MLSKEYSIVALTVATLRLFAASAHGRVNLLANYTLF